MQFEKSTWNARRDMCIPKRKSVKGQGGLTLVELVISIVVISVAVVGVLQVLNLTNRRSADPQIRKQALSIAEALMEEIQLARLTYCDPSDPTADTATEASVGAGACSSSVENVGRVSGAIRPYMNVDDYVDQFASPLDYTQDAGGNPIVLNSAGGTAVNVTGAYRARVTITPIKLNDISADAAPYNDPTARDSLLISVVVTYNHGSDEIRLDGFRTRYAPNALP